MTYYGRWTYKYEIATQKGAAAAIIIHETGPAGYPYDVVRGSNSQEQFDVISPDAEKRVPVEGWITTREGEGAPRGRRAGLRRAQGGRGAQGLQARPARRQGDVRRQDRRAQDPVAQRRRQARGRRQERRVRRLHGALGPPRQGHDAQGRPDLQRRDRQRVAARRRCSRSRRRYTKLPPPPRRSILFLSVTAEEKGLLGAKYYATHPLYPLNKTVADINMDGINQWGEDERLHGHRARATRRSTTSSPRRSRRRAASCGPTPSRRRASTTAPTTSSSPSRACPRSTSDAGTEYIGKPAGYGQQKRDEYTNNDYHKPSRRSEGRLGLRAAASGRADAVQSRLTRRERRCASRSGSRAPSSRQSATR